MPYTSSIMKKRVGALLRGFTLIELLIVIAIVGILLAIIIGTVAISTKRARDAQRLQDLRSLATVLEFFYTETGYYPVAEGPVTGCGIEGPHWIPDGTNYEWSAPYAPKLPRDPSENCGDLNPYSYAYQSDGSTYDLTARLEGGLPDSGVYFNGSSFSSFTSPITVSISSPLSSPTNQSAIPITVTFSREVVNFTQSSLAIVRGIVRNFSQTLATVYRVVITPTDNDAVVVSLSNGAVHDNKGVGNLSAEYTITYDSVAPHVSLSPDPLPETVDKFFTVNVNFTKAVANFSVGDVVVQNGTASHLVSIGPGTNINFRFRVTPQNTGLVTVFVPAGAANSAAGNGNVTSNMLQTIYEP